MRDKPFQDYVQAYKWLSLGGPSMPREGYMPRRLSLEDVAAHRSGTQVSLARKLVGEWKTKNIYIDTIARLTYKQAQEIYQHRGGVLISFDKEPTTPLKIDTPLVCSGSGFFVTRDGDVLTSAHVVQDCGKIELIPPRIRFLAHTLRRRQRMMISPCARPKTVAKFRSGSAIRQGASVLVYGFPLSGAPASSGNATVGHVTALAGLCDDPKLLQVSASVQPGSSGGPLFDAAGALIGVIVGKLEVFGVADAVGDIPQNVNFAVKGSVATSFVEAHTPDLETTETAVIGQWKTSLTWLARLRFSFDVWTKSEHEQPTSLRSKRAGFV